MDEGSGEELSMPDHTLDNDPDADRPGWWQDGNGDLSDREKTVAWVICWVAIGVAVAGLWKGCS